MSKCSIFMFIVVTIQLLSVHGENNEDGLCQVVNELCVENVLEDISKAAKNIRYIADTIEDSMRKKDINRYTLQQNINIIRKEIMLHSRYPPSKYHDQLADSPNINKSGFIDLLSEEHKAVSYLYASIKSLLAYNHIHDNAYDVLFHKIRDGLRNEMFCRYRNILYLYSANWQSVDRIKGIRFPESRKHNMTSLDYRSYAILILELLGQWMEKVEKFIGDVENKFV